MEINKLKVLGRVLEFPIFYYKKDYYNMTFLLLVGWAWLMGEGCCADEGKV